MPKKRPEEILVGYCDVDAGLIMVGDPCYASIDDNGDPERRHKIHDWSEFVSWLYEDKGHDEPFLHKAIPHPRGHMGAGVVVASGFGDGTYPVYITIEDFDSWGLRVTGLRIDFNPEDDECEVK